MLAKYIKKLKPRDCDILYSYYYGGLTQSGIAQVFGVSPSRISQIIHHAQGLFKKMIEG